MDNRQSLNSSIPQFPFKDKKDHHESTKAQKHEKEIAAISMGFAPLNPSYGTLC
jgi:hypothetical protein